RRSLLQARARFGNAAGGGDESRSVPRLLLERDVEQRVPSRRPGGNQREDGLQLRVDRVGPGRDADGYVQPEPPLRVSRSEQRSVWRRGRLLARRSVPQRLDRPGPSTSVARQRAASALAARTDISRKGVSSNG